MTDVLYRYEETHYAPPADEFGDASRGPGSCEVHLREYRIIRRTPKGYWVALDLGDFGISSERFVLASSRKRFACPTEAEARESFRARKRAQIRIYRARIERTEQALRAFDRLVAKEAA